METISIQLPDDVLTRLRELTRATGQDGNEYLVEAIRESLDDLEDLHDAQQRMIEIRAGRSKTTPLEEVMKRYGLES
ncbi:MAG: CopG family transcriptional regulator [Magnetococcales bacterium]|nr:CopG family transcriptional regulator [Magnetococcales bacterium]MBF0151864.1 CopG family transcriptional regulator [Magnetococcales bacterium]MBF0629550.1 CopG family transcriptional regulator [Magnetococcales bacterium]